MLHFTSFSADGIFFCFLEKENAEPELRPLVETHTPDWSPEGVGCEIEEDLHQKSTLCQRG